MMFRHLTPVVLLSLIFTLGLAGTTQAGVQDFTIPVFDANYYLSRDSEHISHLRVTEHIVADFPGIDQNHGILRAIPKSYEHHGLSLHIDQVTGDNGVPRAYTTSTQNDNLVLKIGDASTYVHGRQTYDISYTMANVTTKPPAGFDAQFWDVNGDQWLQVFDSVTAHVHLTPELATALLADDVHCYTGVRSSTGSDCTFKYHGTGGDQYIDFATTRPLSVGETLTYELGFTAGTFSGYRMPTSELIGLILKLVFLGILPIGATLLFVVIRWRRYGRDPAGRGVIIAEYTAPKELSALASGVLLNESFQPKFLSAQIIDLAVRGYFKIYEVKIKKLLQNKTSYEVELIHDTAGLRSEEQAVVDLLLGASAAPGTRVNLDTLTNKLYSGASAIGQNVTSSLTTSGYFRIDPNKAKLPYFIGGFALIAASFFWFPYSLGLMICGFIVMIGGLFMPARTVQGVTLREYLLGLKLYMQMTEADRIKVMQSPRGELTEKIDTSDTARLVKLYEKLLPYAMLFGIEKDWAKEFAALYTETPEWYSGHSGFSAAYFAGSMASFGAASTASFTAPSSSGSGGSAGGGGGGGGGGGW